MKRGFIPLLVLTTSILLTPDQVWAQEQQSEVSEATFVEQEVVMSALRTAISIIQDISQRHAGEPVSQQLQLLSGRMSSAAVGSGGFRSPEKPFNLDDLSVMLTDIRRELRTIVRDLNRDGDDELTDALLDVIDDLNRAIQLAIELEREYTPVRDQWARYDRVERRQRVRITSNGEDRKKQDDNDSGWFGNDFNWRRHSSDFVGEYTQQWPFGETAQYRPIPAFRYNRVEGFVLGIHRLPLNWSHPARARLYGQIGYAFSLEDVRYEIGLESRLGPSYRRGDFDLKIGGSYKKNTGTADAWKASWAENTVAAALFRYDFFDYYETEGWKLYAVGMLTPYIQFSVGYHSDEYRGLDLQTDWSLFGGDPFRFNPFISEGEMHSVVATLEGGRIRGLRSQPSGFAFRLEAEFGEGLGGDFSFNRYVADVRTYARLSRYTGLNLRLRGGYADGNVPVQKAFTLGGVGSVRAYPQNYFYGSRMLLANAEYTLYRQRLLDDFLNDLAVFGLFDAGWTNAGGQNEFDTADVFSAAGFGISLDERTIRLEFAWPLKDVGFGLKPSIWLRLNPTF